MLGIQVLLSTYNGEKYLYEQLESLKNQDFKGKLDVLIRDDGSVDNTISIIEKYESLNIELIKGRNIGVIDSFFSLIENSGESDFFALCDQDDVWDQDKLRVAVEKLNKYSCEKPLLYFSTTRNVDENLIPTKEKKKVMEKYNIHQAILGNNATGCTMVFNKCLRDLIVRYRPKNIIMHDHWIYLLCIACGGQVVLDLESHISYRQHSHNTIGSKNSLKKRLKHSGFCNGRNVRSGIALQILNEYKDIINEENKSILCDYAFYKKNMIEKIKFFKREKKYIYEFKRRVIFFVQLILNIL